MTRTDSRNSRLSQIEHVMHGRLGVIAKSALAILAITTALGLFIRYGIVVSLVGDRQVAPNDSVLARWPSSCSAAFAPNLILQRTGCENSRELVQRR